MQNAPLGLGRSFSQLESGQFWGDELRSLLEQIFGGRNMRLFWVGCVFFFPGIGVIHTHMNGIFVRIGSQKSTHHFSRRKTSPQFPRAAGSGEGHCRSCSKGGGGEWFFQWRGVFDPRTWHCSGDFYVLRL